MWVSLLLTLLVLQHDTHALALEKETTVTTTSASPHLPPETSPPQCLADFAASYTDTEHDERQLAWSKHTLWSMAAAVSFLPIETYSTPPMLEPADMYNNRATVQGLMKLYQEEDNGYRIPQEEKDSLFATELDETTIVSRPATYGEITQLGARQLFQQWQKKNDNDDSLLLQHLVDLGSGVGKLCVQAVLEVPTLTAVTAVELSPTRHEVAERVWQRIEPFVKEAREQFFHVETSPVQVNLTQGDMFTVDLSTATHVYVASLCFSSEMLDRLGEKLVHDIRAGSSVRSIATLKRFRRKWEEQLGGKPRTALLEMTWTRPFGSEVYFYDIPPR